MHIIDDCIPKLHQDFFENIALGHIEKGLPWTVKYEATAIEQDVKPISFKHVPKSDAEISPEFPNFVIVPQHVSSQLGYILKDIIFARLFLTVPYKTKLNNHAPHTDLDYPHSHTTSNQYLQG